MAKAKYPQVIYVRKEKDRDDEFLTAMETAAEHAVVDEEVEIAIYNLSRVTKVKAKAEVE